MDPRTKRRLHAQARRQNRRRSTNVFAKLSQEKIQLFKEVCYYNRLLLLFYPLYTSTSPVDRLHVTRALNIPRISEIHFIA